MPSKKYGDNHDARKQRLRVQLCNTLSDIAGISNDEHSQYE